MVNILSINGGGVKGIGALRLLLLINRDIEEPTKYFDGFSGTSTGAIIASGLACNIPVFDLITMYKNLARKIFSKKNILPFGSKYNNRALKAELKNVFGDRKLGELHKPLYLGYYDFVLNKPRVFDRIGNEDMPLWKAVLISCSAPTYFPPIDRRYADGGLILQNPSLVGAVGYAREKSVPISNIRIVSLDTDGHKEEQKLLPSNPNLWDWVPRLIDTSLTGSESIMDFFCKNLPFGGYLLLSPQIEKKYSMDDITIMAEYESIFHNYYKTNREAIIHFIKGGEDD